jgi:peptidoglycan/xylan/chitin deacetylase (PgdA/CDA1 family)
MKITFAYDNLEHASAIEFAAEELLLRVGIPYRICNYEDIPDDSVSLLISYGGEMPELPESRSFPWMHISGSFFWSEYRGGVYPLPTTPVRTFEELPVLFWGTQGVSTRQDERVGPPDKTISGDILASAFFLLSRCEETTPHKRDDHDRFPVSQSFAFQNHLLGRPLVDEYASMIRATLESLGQLPEWRNPWGTHPYAFCMTHDIDRIQLFDTVRHLAGAVYGAFRKRKMSALHVLADYVRTKLGKKNDPYDNLAHLSALVTAYGARATYFFLAGGSTRYDGRYTLDQIATSVHNLSRQGHEIGLHGSYDAYADREMMTSERLALEGITKAPIQSIRQHYLRFRTPATWQVMETSGFKVDSTLDHAEHEGFRAGTSFPFRAYDVQANRVLEILEIPLVAMDATLYGYRGLSKCQAQTCLLELLSNVRDVGGSFVMLWHNSSIYDPLYPGGEDIVRTTIAQAAADNALLGTLNDLATLWNEHYENLTCAS